MNLAMTYRKAACLASAGTVQKCMTMLPPQPIVPTIIAVVGTLWIATLIGQSPSSQSTTGCFPRDPTPSMELAYAPWAQDEILVSGRDFTSWDLCESEGPERQMTPKISFPYSQLPEEVESAQGFEWQPSAATRVQAATAISKEQLVYFSTISQNERGEPLKLVADIYYDPSRSSSPLAVVMHGYTGVASSVAQNALWLCEQGFFVIVPSMRGRDGAEGKRDSGGLEIYDIVDAIYAAVNKYGQLISKDRWYITGYSGGGANVLAVLMRFPEMFTAASAFFPMTDYGYDSQTGWFYQPGSAPYRTILVADIGDPSQGEASVLDRYLARSVRFGAANNIGTEVHLYVNEDEQVCPAVHSLLYVAYAAEFLSQPGLVTNINLHIGRPNLYYDFNRNGTCEADEKQYWPHRYPAQWEQKSAEEHFLTRLLNGEILGPRLPKAGRFFVGGWVVTSRFSVWLGDGQDGAGWLDYELGDWYVRFKLILISNDRKKTATLNVYNLPWEGSHILVYRNGSRAGYWVGSELELQDGDELVLLPEGAQLRFTSIRSDGNGVVFTVQGPANSETILFQSFDLEQWEPTQIVRLDEYGQAKILQPAMPGTSVFFRLALKEGESSQWLK